MFPRPVDQVLFAQSTLEVSEMFIRDDCYHQIPLNVSITGNPICRCEPGLVPKPDTITGCGPECVQDPDCQFDYVCQSQRCVPRPDPCDPSPCGPNTMCMENQQGNPICRCLAGFIPMPDTISGCKRECEVDRDCGPGNICDNYR